MNTIDAFILVGGQSTRFGRDKATAELNGGSVLDRIWRTVSEALPESDLKLVSADAEQVLKFGADRSFVLDIYKDRGPFGAVHTALANAQSEWVFVIACDLPLVTSELIERLQSFITDDIDAVLPVQPDGEIQPLCSFYRVRSCLAATDDILSRPRPSPPVKELSDAVKTKFIEFSLLKDLPGSESLFLNMNSEKDLGRAIELIGETS